MVNKKFTMSVMLLLTMLLAAASVSASDIVGPTNDVNTTLVALVASGGNFTMNVSIAGQTDDGDDHISNVTFEQRCERESSYTMIGNVINTSANQTTFSIGFNTSAVDDCSMDIRVTAYNDTAGSQQRDQEEINDLYINNSVLAQAFVTAQDAVQKSSNGNLTITVTTDAQALDVNGTVNGRAFELTRTNTSGMRWTGEILNLPAGSYTYTINAYDLDSALVPASQRGIIQLKKSSSGALVVAAATTAEAESEPSIMGIDPVLIIGAIAIWWFFLRGK